MNQGKDVVVVVGGLGLLGRAVTEKLLVAGKRVIVVDCAKSTDSLQKNIDFIECDLTLSEREEQLYQQLKTTYGECAAWINAAYPKTKMYGSYNYLDDTQDDGIAFFHRHAELFYRSCRVAIKLFLEAGGGSIVNFSSIYGPMGPDMRVYQGTTMHNAACYAMVKEAILGLTRYISTCFAHKNIRCNAICPGGVQDQQTEKFIQRYSERVPMGRMATPQEIAAAAFFLCSPEASYITGQALMVDGGLSAW